MAEALAGRLIEGRYLQAKVPTATLVDRLDQVITGELLLEDRLDADVKELLKAYTTQFEAGRLDYRRMFQLTKAKLAQERGVVL